MVFTSRLPELVLAAQAGLIEINEILNTRYLQRKSVESEPKVRRMAAFRSLQQLKELQHTLLTVRINLAAMLNVFTAYELYQLVKSSHPHMFLCHMQLLTAL
jgi:hypothetical protein